ncbi:MAG: ABC transporter transmembrane domain-containing protein [Pseudomonadota bacterium]
MKVLQDGLHKREDVGLKEPDNATDTDATTLGLLLRLWRDWVRPYWRRLALAVVFMALFALSEAGFALGVEWLLETLGEGTTRALYLAPAVVVVLGLANAATMYIQQILTNSVAMGVIADFQKKMFAHLLGADFAQLTRGAPGGLVSRFTNDVNMTREMLVRAPNSAVRDVLRIVVLFGTMVYFDWLLALAVIVIYPVAGVPIERVGRYLRGASARVQSQLGDMTSLLTQSISGALMVKTYGLNAYEQTRADAAFDIRYRLVMKMIGSRALVEPIIMAIGAVAVAAVVAVAAWRINSDALTIERFAAFITALLLLAQPARSLGTLNAVFQEGLAAVQRIFELLDEPPAIVDVPEAKPLTVTDGRVQFRNVSFSYDGADGPALQDFSLDIAPGATVALVGESGAGKSTVFNLLPRLYEPTSGEILIDGQAVGAARLASVRAASALVSQESILFNDTVRANIAFGKLTAGDAEIEAAARAAAADDFIRTLPEGYASDVGDRGGKLSGGQRQRIALARAILKDAKILLLDEATSALDAESERKVQEALERLKQGRTTIVIAHRLATVRDADLICVMDKGRIVEQGRHDALLAEGGLYARLCKLQFEGA